MTKKEKAERAALRQRLLDMMYGAFGGYEPANFEGAPDNEDEPTSLPGELGLDAWCRWVGAINMCLLTKNHRYLTKPHLLEKFEGLDMATNFLYEHGVRAVKEQPDAPAV